MTCSEVLEELRSLANEKIRDVNAKNGASEKQIGVNLSHLRDLAKKIKTNHPLALELWATGVDDAMLLAVLLMKPKELTLEQADGMMQESPYFKVTDWLESYVIRKTKLRDELRRRWIVSPKQYVARAGWSLQADDVANREPEDVEGCLNRIEGEMKDAPFRVQESMNYCLVQIAVRYPELRRRCLDIAERLQVFKDYPVAKGCISPYAPVWIDYALSQKS